MFPLKNAKNKLFSLIFILILPLLILFQSSMAFAARPKLILFCADWNARCRKAVPVCASVVESYGNRVDYLSLNIDNNSDIERSIQLGIPTPNVIPYIYILGKSGNIKDSRKYNGESPQSLKKILDPIILPEL